MKESSSSTGVSKSTGRAERAMRRACLPCSPPAPAATRRAAAAPPAPRSAHELAEVTPRRPPLNLSSERSAREGSSGSLTTHSVEVKFGGLPHRAVV